MSERPTWRIPRRAHRSLTALADLSPSEFAALFAAVNPSGRLQVADSLIASVRQAAPRMAADADEFVVAIMSLIAALPRDEDAIRPTAKDLVADSPLKLDEDQQGVLVERLVSLLTAESLRLTAKALEVSTEYEHVYSDARILTDIRPVFSDRETTAPAAAVIINNLKLNYYGADGHIREFHVALDRADVQSLRDVLDRALDKMTSITTLIGDAHLASWDGEG